MEVCSISDTSCNLTDVLTGGWHDGAKPNGSTTIVGPSLPGCFRDHNAQRKRGFEEIQNSGDYYDIYPVIYSSYLAQNGRIPGQGYQEAQTKKLNQDQDHSRHRDEYTP
jgi:hypothetical protein